MAKKTADKEPEIPEPLNYTIVSEEHYHEGDIWHVKLSKPVVVRLLTGPRFGDPEFAEAEYVNITTSTWQGEDDKGTFYYNETTVVASNPEGTDEDARLYFVNSRLELWQILFNLGIV